MNNEMTANNMSNEETIEVLKGIVFDGFDRTTPKERQALDVAIKALEERPQGDWEIVDAEGWKIWNCVCTECGHDPQEYIGGTENWWLRKQHLPNFCPNCGVRIVNVKGGAE